jgi:hypothetical protein
MWLPIMVSFNNRVTIILISYKRLEMKLKTRIYFKERRWKVLVNSAPRTADLNIYV